MSQIVLIVRTTDTLKYIIHCSYLCREIYWRQLITNKFIEDAAIRERMKYATLELQMSRFAFSVVIICINNIIST